MILGQKQGIQKVETKPLHIVVFFTAKLVLRGKSFLSVFLSFSFSQKTVVCPGSSHVEIDALSPREDE